MTKKTKLIVFQVLKCSYEGGELLLGTFSTRVRARDCLKKEANAFKKEIQERPSSIGHDRISFANDEGYNYDFEIREITVE